MPQQISTALFKLANLMPSTELPEQTGFDIQAYTPWKSTRTSHSGGHEPIIQPSELQLLQPNPTHLPLHWKAQQRPQGTNTQPLALDEITEPQDASLGCQGEEKEAKDLCNMRSRSAELTS